MNARRLLFGTPASKNSNEFWWHFLWLLSVGMTISYGTYLFFGSLLSGGTGVTSPIAAVDVVRAGEHHISGVVQVPSTCHRLSIEPRKVSQSQFELAFSLWQEPSRDCARVKAIETFHTVVFAPSVGVRFTATVDDVPAQLQLTPYYE